MRPIENRHEVDRVTARLGVLPLDADTAGHAAERQANLERRAQQIGSCDTLTAGHARSRGLVVVTANLRAFSRVEGLRTEDSLAVPLRAASA